jgi:hypothetical protein
MTTERDEAALEAAEDREPIDPDFELIVHYMENWLSSDDTRKVAQRLKEDQAFAQKVAPLVEMWAAPINFRTAYETHTAASAEAAEAAQAARPVAPLAARAEYPVRKIERRSNETKSAGYDAPFRPKRSPGQKTLGGLFAGTQAVGWLAALFLFFVGVPTVVYQIGFANGRETELLRLFPAQGLAPAPADSTGKAPMESRARTVQVGRSSFMRLRAGSRFSVSHGLLGFALIVGLNGEATVEVGLLDPKLELSTPAGMVELSHGIYAVRSSGDPNEETLITVGQGKATLKGTLGAADLVLSAGEHGRLADQSPPRRTNGGDGYPAVDQPKRTTP